jgi:hypothetical protein
MESISKKSRKRFTGKLAALMVRIGVADSSEVVKGVRPKKADPKPKAKKAGPKPKAKKAKTTIKSAAKRVKK